MTIEKYYNTCPRDCYDTCAMITTVEDGKAVNLQGNPNHHITQGFLCWKIQNGLKFVYSPERLKLPLKRVGKKGRTTSGRLRGKKLIRKLPTEWRTYRLKMEQAQSFHFTITATWGF